MSTYTEYVEKRMQAAADEQAQRRDEAGAADYEAALARLGVALDEEARA